ncbi:Rec8 like protein-domain-containing protein [Fennellomyces sp. T-0311]|nr:Rec8 like protein-domain-containing protein [Fennellomyces sp. T-0311]
MTELLIGGSGPLARVWLASHWERKVSKSQFLQTNLEKTIDAITTDDHEPLTLRMSGQLLLGVARIYSRKTRYLLEDCNEALVKIKLSFKKGNVNMPDIQHTVASIKSITLPERLTEFDILLPDEPLLDIDMDTIDAVLDSSSQIASSQDITLSDIGDLSFGNDWDINPTAETERARTDAENVNELDVGMSSVEQGRRDNEMELGREGSFIDDINSPLSKMNIDGAQQQDDNYLDFDDFDFGDDYADMAPPQPPAAEEFHRADDSQIMSGSSLMHSGLIADDDDDQLMFETQPLDEVSEPVAPRRRRRRLVVDRVTEIPHDQLRAQVSDTSSLVNRDANALPRSRKTQAKVDWKKPIACDNSTKLGALFARLNARKDTAGETEVDMNETREDAEEPVAQVEQQAQYDDYGMDYDDFDFGDTPAPVTDEPAEAAGDMDNTSQFTQNTQSTIGRSTREVLDTIQSRLEVQETVSFGELAPHNATKSEAARRFYDVLLLTTKDMLKVQQNQAFGEIQIRA